MADFSTEIEITLKSLKSKTYPLKVATDEPLSRFFSVIEEKEPGSLADCTLIVSNQKGKVKRIKLDRDGEKLVGEFLENGDRVDVTVDFKSACAGGKKCEFKK